MNKKILKSLLVIGIIGLLTTGATIAFFNDTETSEGNTFTAGSIDLKVDHIGQSYNEMDCMTCNVTVVSDTTNIVTATDGGSDETNLSHNAVIVSNPHAAWTAIIDGADWIWATDPTTEYDATHTVEYSFKKTFEWLGPAHGASLSLDVGADNSYEIWLNGTNIAGDNTEQNFSSSGQDNYSGATVAGHINQGTNILEIRVKNWAPNDWMGTPSSNPGGLMYKLVIDGNCEDSYFKQHCQLWEEKDLDGELFFDLIDVKPGDWGENTISLHVYDNDAYGCMAITTTEDAENDLIDPETEAGDATADNGELDDELTVFLWRDNGDNIYQEEEEPLLEHPMPASIAFNTIYPLATPANGKTLVASNNYYIGIAWCAGSMSEGGCDGTSMGNRAQTDGLKVDLSFYVEQTRHNGEFTCSPAEQINGEFKISNETPH